MPPAYSVEILVKEVRGTREPACGYKPGDRWRVTGNETVNDFCGWAFAAIFPFITPLRFGGEFPWEADKDTALVCCPDPHNSVVFELRRVKE